MNILLLANLFLPLSSQQRLPSFQIVLTLLFGAGSAWVVYTALYVEHVWESPVDEIISRIMAVTIFTLFIVFWAAVWKWYDPVLPILGKYSIYFYLSHTFLFMWAINYFEFEMSIRFAIATGIIIVVSLVMGILMEMLLKPLNKKLKGSKQNIGDMKMAL